MQVRRPFGASDLFLTTAANTSAYIGGVKGHKRYRSGAWRLAVFTGFDPVTNKRIDVHETVRAPNDRAGAKAADARLAAIISAVEEGRELDTAARRRGGITVGVLADRRGDRRVRRVVATAERGATGLAVRSGRAPIRARPGPGPASRRSDRQLPAPQHEGAAGRQGRCAAGALRLRPSPAGHPAARRDKSGAWSAWYEWAVPVADDLYDEYLAELEAEGLI